MKYLILFKVYLNLILLTFVFTFNSFAFAIDESPTLFGYKWGISLWELKQNGVDVKGNIHRDSHVKDSVNIFEFKNRKIGYLSVDGTTFCLYKDKLFLILASFELNNDDFKRLLDSLINKYGLPDQKSVLLIYNYDYYWEDVNGVHIALSYNVINENGSLGYTYRSISDEYHKDREITEKEKSQSIDKDL